MQIDRMKLLCLSAACIPACVSILDLHSPFLQAMGLTTADFLGWCEQLASVLAYLHDFSPPIVHRDIKLDNVCGAMSRDRQGAHMTHSFG